MATNEQNLSPNYWAGRAGYHPEAIVIHITDGFFPGDLAWIKNPKSRASYHTLINKDGDTFRVVSYLDSAWHAGAAIKSSWPLLKDSVNPNRYTIGIALSLRASEKPTRAQVMKLSETIATVSKEFNIPIDELHVIGHNKIRGDKSCPGTHLDLNVVRWLATL